MTITSKSPTLRISSAACSRSGALLDLAGVVENAPHAKPDKRLRLHDQAAREFRQGNASGIGCSRNRPAGLPRLDPNRAASLEGLQFFDRPETAFALCDRFGLRYRGVVI
jgi:hypothetical protein